MVWRDSIFGELSRMQRDMDRIFDSFNSDPNVINLSDELSGDSNFRRAVSNFSENEKEYVLNVELPGMTKEEINLKVTGRGIEIRAAKKKEEKKEDKDKGSYMHARSFAGFYQAIDLPEDSDVDKIDAKYENGVLTLRVPRKVIQVDRDKEIKIN